MSNPEARAAILEDFKIWRANNVNKNDEQESYIEEYKRLMPKPGEFVAEA